MRFNHKIIHLTSGAFMLCVGLPNMAPAINSLTEELTEQKVEREAERQGDVPGLAEKDKDTAKGLYTIYGEVLQVEHDKYLVKKYDGDVVRLHIDNNTRVSGTVSQGDRIVAKVNDQEVALTIQPAK